MLNLLLFHIIVLIVILITFSVIGGKRKWSGTKIGNWQLISSLLWTIIVMTYIHYYCFDVFLVFKSFLSN
jgi:hypothetical protein